MNELGNNIVKLRQQKNMTQRQIAEKLNYTEQTISNWERGKSFPDVESIKALCKIFNCTTDQLLGVSPMNKVENNIKEEPTLQYYKEKSTIAKILKISIFVMVISCVLFLLFGSLVTHITSLKHVFMVFVALAFRIVFFIVLFISFILFFIGKSYNEKTANVVLFYIFISAYIILNIFNKQIIFKYIAGIFYFLASVFAMMAFKSRFRDMKIFKLEIFYLLLSVVTVSLYLAFGKLFTFLIVPSFCVLYIIKQDRTIEIPYYAIKSDSSKIFLDENKMQSESNEQAVNIKNEILNALRYFPKIFIVSIFVVTLIYGFNVEFFDTKEVVIGGVVLPFLFYLGCFLMKKSSNTTVKIINVVLICIYLVLQFLLMQMKIYSIKIMIIEVILLVVICGIYAFKYGQKEEYFYIKGLITLLSLGATVAFVFWGLGDKDVLLGIQLVNMFINMLLVMILSFLHEEVSVKNY